MFYEDDERFLNPDLLHVVRRELYAINQNLQIRQFGIKYVPTHTEDGIPIRKLYVSNLPLKTTRIELFGVFAQYGFIKSCWLRIGEKGPDKVLAPTYAFVTYSNPADAHKALQAPLHEKTLRGRTLHISPADSWHQPIEEGDEKLPPTHSQHPNYKLNLLDEDGLSVELDHCSRTLLASKSKCKATSSAEEMPAEEEEASGSEPQYTILDVLNRDCLNHIMSYMSMRELILTERVSKGWQSMIREYLEGTHTLKTSWWQREPVLLTTAVLRRVLARAGAALRRLHVDAPWAALNDRTPHTIGKFCPALEEFKVSGMQTKNWNPVIYGCKELKSLTFDSCESMTDASLVQLMKGQTCIESLTVANNAQITGLFLTSSNPKGLNSLAFINCYSLQGTVLCAAIDNLPDLTTLRLDDCPVTMWNIVPLILKKLPQLEELSLCDYVTTAVYFPEQDNDAFCEALSNLKRLKKLMLCRNIYISNAVLKCVASSCPLLEDLDVSGCNSREKYPNPGVGDAGVAALRGGCFALRRLDVSYLRALSDAGVRALRGLPGLRALAARGNAALSAAAFAACLAACPIEELDVCGCRAVSAQLLGAAVQALQRRPRRLRLWLHGTSAVEAPDFPTHKLLTVNVDEDRSNPHQRTDVRRGYESPDDSYIDLELDPDDYPFFLPDDDLFLEDEIEDYEDMIQFGLHAPDIILL